MDIPLDSAVDVFLFIVFCSAYVCSILWIFGDMAIRGARLKCVVFPLVFIIAGVAALAFGIYWALAGWPIGYVLWFLVRPKDVIKLTD